MRYLSYQSDFLFESIRIDESMFYMSPKIREKLSTMDNDIARNLLEVELTNIKPDITFIDMDDDEGFITFTQIKKADKLFKDYGSNTDITTGIRGHDGSKIDQSVIDAVYKFDMANVFTKGRNKVKIGKLVNKAFPGKYSDKEVEEFVNLYKSSVEKIDESFKMVSGEEIADWYNNEEIEDSGNLGNSCMNGEYSGFFEIYYSNPDVCSMLILVEGEKLIGRALVWKPTMIGHGVKAEYFMDRVYVANDSDLYKFHRYAESNGWIRKAYNDYESHSRVYFNGEESYLKMEVEVGKSSYDNYPYMDTFTEFKDGVLYNNNEYENGGILLNDTGGGYTVDGEYSNYYDDTIPNEYCIWSGPIGDTIDSRRMVEVRKGSSFNTGYYPDDHGDIYYDEWEDEYINIDDSAYSEYHSSYVYDYSTAISSIDSFEIDYISRYVVDDMDDFLPLVYFREIDPLWIKYLNKENNSDLVNDYDVIMRNIIVFDYKNINVPEEYSITTYAKKGDEFLSRKDQDILNGVIDIDNDLYESRLEDRFEYVKRVWVDSGRYDKREQLIEKRASMDDKEVPNEYNNMFSDTESFIEEKYNKAIESE